MVEVQNSPGVPINRVMDIYTRHNDIYYKAESDESNIIHVLRDVKNIDCNPFDYSVLKLCDFFKSSNNKKFAKICPSLVLLGSGTIGLCVQMCNKTMNVQQDFLIIRENLGDILSAIVEMTASKDISDRSDNKYVFGEPINLKGFRRQFMLQMMENSENLDFFQFIKMRSESLKKYCAHKTRGMRSVIRAIDRITESDINYYNSSTQTKKNETKK